MLQGCCSWGQVNPAGLSGPGPFTVGLLLLVLFRINISTQKLHGVLFFPAPGGGSPAECFAALRSAEEQLGWMGLDVLPNETKSSLLPPPWVLTLHHQQHQNLHFPP